MSGLKSARKGFAQSRVGRLINRTAVVAYKETLHIQRDPQVLGFALLLPVVLLLLFGFAISFDMEHIPLAVVDQDRSPESRELVNRFTAAELFVLEEQLEKPDEAEALFKRGDVAATLVIPKGYSRKLARGEDASIQMIVDGSDNNSASVSMGYAQAIANQVAAEQPGAARAFMGGASLKPPVELKPRALFNPAQRSAVFIVPGLIALIPALVAVIMTALTVAREFERGSMEQLFATPLGRLEIVLGKLTPYLLLGLLQVLLVVVVGVYVFNIPFEGSLLLLMGVTALFLMAMSMQGLVISVVARNQVLASQMAVITTLLPTLLLSGFIFPLENMPFVLQVIARILPPSHFMDAIRAIVLRGNDWGAIAGDALAIMAFFGVMLALAVKRFSRKVA